MCVRACVRACVCVCACVRACARLCACVRACVRVCVRVRACARACVCVRACVYVCVTQSVPTFSILLGSAPLADSMDARPTPQKVETILRVPAPDSGSGRLKLLPRMSDTIDTQA